MVNISQILLCTANYSEKSWPIKERRLSPDVGVRGTFLFYYPGIVIKYFNVEIMLF